MRPIDRSSLAELPAEVLICLALTPLAWLLFLISRLLLNGTISLVQLSMAGLCCLALFSLRGWGRWLCVIYDGLMVAALGYQVVQGQGSALVVVQAAALALAALALFWPATVRAFRRPDAQARDNAVSQ